MFWNKKKKVVKTKIKHIPLPILIRQTIYDTMLEPAEGIADAMGLPPISNEVSEMEERASQERIKKFSGLLPFIDSHSDIAARIATAAYALGDDEEEISALGFSSDELDKITAIFKLVALSSSMSCISTLFSLGLLETKVASNDEE